MKNKKSHGRQALSGMLFFLLGLGLGLLYAPSVMALDEDGRGYDEMIPTQITASSTLGEEGFSHDPIQMTDYNWSSDWCEGASGSGVGESLTFTFDPRETIDAFTILPGFWKSEKLFYENAAPTKIRLSCGSFSQTFDLSECLDYGNATLGGYPFSLSQVVTLEDPLVLTILEVREGSRYEDCSITELHFFGEMLADTWKKNKNEVKPKDAWASSVLTEEGFDNSVWQMFDHDWETGWTEGAYGTGVGETISFTFPEGTVLNGLSILPGFWKSPSLFSRNAAPSLIRLTWEDYSQEISLDDYAADYRIRPLEGNYFSFSAPLSYYGPLTIEILEVREGSYYEDCVISELHFYGTTP